MYLQNNIATLFGQVFLIPNDRLLDFHLIFPFSKAPDDMNLCPES